MGRAYKKENITRKKKIPYDIQKKIFSRYNQFSCCPEKKNNLVIIYYVYIKICNVLGQNKKHVNLYIIKCVSENVAPFTCVIQPNRSGIV